MHLRVGMVGFVVLGVLSARADEPGAPLENSKQELKALQKDQTTHGTEGPPDKLRDSMPRLQTPGSGILPVEPLAARKSPAGQSKKMDAQKNWLLDGMDKLDNNAKARNRNARDKLTETKDEPADPDDPDYLLNLYSEQKKDSDTKAETKQSTVSHKDPMAPFLQGWLADSPVRGKFFDDYIKKPDMGAGGSAATPAALQESGTNTAFAGFDPGGHSLRQGQGGAAQVASNPYLQALDMSALQDTAGRNRQAVAPAAAMPPPVSLANPEPPANQPEKKLQLPTVSDDSKYFPQLKKF
jgi:hypothetical protein